MDELATATIEADKVIAVLTMQRIYLDDNASTPIDPCRCRRDAALAGG